MSKRKSDGFPESRFRSIFFWKFLKVKLKKKTNFRFFNNSKEAIILLSFFEIFFEATKKARFCNAVLVLFKNKPESSKFK